MNRNMGLEHEKLMFPSEARIKLPPRGTSVHESTHRTLAEFPKITGPQRTDSDRR